MIDTLESWVTRMESLELDGLVTYDAGDGFDDFDLPPIRRVRERRSIPEPQFGGIVFRAFAGVAFAVCVFHGPGA